MTDFFDCCHIDSGSCEAKPKFAPNDQLSAIDDSKSTKKARDCPWSHMSCSWSQKLSNAGRFTAN